MAEPAVKIPTPDQPRPKPAGNIVSFEEERRRRRNLRQQTQAARQAQAAEQQAGAEEGMIPVAEKPQAPVPPRPTEAEIAKRYAAGPGMEGVTPSYAGGAVTPKEGGEKPPAGPSGKKEEAKKPAAPAAAPAPKEGAKPGPEGEGVGEEGAEEEEERRPMTRQEKLQRQLEEQQKSLAASRQELEQEKKAKEEKKTKGEEEKGLKRAMGRLRMRAKEKEVKKKEKGLARTAAALASQTASKQLLKGSWTNLIDSFGATYFYIAFHFIAAYFTPYNDFFCRFGEEWQMQPPLPQPYTGWVSRQAHEAGEKMRQFANDLKNKALELLEIVGCVLIGLFIFVLIYAILVLIGVIAYAATHKFETLAAVGLEGLKAIAYKAVEWVTGTK